MYNPYVSINDYYEMGYDAIPAEELSKFLLKASRHVDAMTFNRILRFGWDRLTDFQRDAIQAVICEHAEFLYENKDAIESMFDSYSINGVSMSFKDSANVQIEQGLPIRRDTYKLLAQTGLTCRLAGW